MVIIASILCFFSLLILVVPFMGKDEGPLAEASYEKSTDLLQKKMTAIIERYVQDEDAFKQDKLSAKAWSARKNYLLNRYIDLARRHDFLSKTA